MGNSGTNTLKTTNCLEEQPPKTNEKQHRNRAVPQFPPSESGDLEGVKKTKPRDHGQQQADHRTEHSEDAGEDELISGVPGVIQENGSRTGQRIHGVPRNGSARMNLQEKED